MSLCHSFLMSNLHVHISGTYVHVIFLYRSSVSNLCIMQRTLRLQYCFCKYYFFATFATGGENAKLKICSLNLKYIVYCILHTGMSCAEHRDVMCCIQRCHVLHTEMSCAAYRHVMCNIQRCHVVHRDVNCSIQGCQGLPQGQT